MKRILIVLTLASMVLGLGAFACQSSELTSAKLYISQKNWDKAQEMLEKEVAKNPQADEGYFLLGHVLRQGGKTDAMLEAFDKSLAISKKFEEKIKNEKLAHWADSFNKGVGFYNKAAKATTKDSIQMHYNTAIEKFEDAIKCAPDSANSYQNLAFTFLNAGRQDEAIAPFKKLIELEGSSKSYVSLSELYLTKGNKLMDAYKAGGAAKDSVEAMKLYDENLALLEEAQAKYPEDSDLLVLLSNTYIAADKIAEAKETFAKGVKAEPDNKFYRYNYGVLLLGANDYEGAATQFEEALKIDPEYTNSMYNLAVTYVKWGSEMREALNADDDSKEYQEKYNLALPHLVKYLEEKPEEPAIWELLGKVYGNLGDNAKMEEAFKKADAYRGN